jgi:hypothetical protein
MYRSIDIADSGGITNNAAFDTMGSQIIGE